MFLSSLHRKAFDHVWTHFSTEGPRRHIANLLESGVEIAAADMPEANRFLLHVMAAVAEHEAQAISDRTRAALAAAKKGAVVNKARALTHAENVLPVIEQIRAGGASLR